MHRAELNQTANELWQMGVVEIIFNGTSEAVSFNTNNYNRLKEVLHELTPDQISFLIALGAPLTIDWEHGLL